MKFSKIKIPCITMIRSARINESGAALVIALMFVAILGLLGTTAVVLTTTDIKIGANYKTSVQAFNAAQAGLEEARERLSLISDPTIRITDSFPTNLQWGAFIETNVDAQKKGFDNTNGMHIKVASLQMDLNYTVVISHLTKMVGGVKKVVYWGDTDDDGISEQTITPGPDVRNIYVATSYGTRGTAEQVVVANIVRLPPVTAPGALYVEAETDILGNSTYIDGNDACGSGSSLPAIVTPLAGTDLTSSENVDMAPPVENNITGTVNGDATPPSIDYNATNLDVDVMLNNYKGFAKQENSYTVSGSVINGKSWGTPTPGPPPDCSVYNVVYFDTGGTDVKLAAGCEGCGILLVDGDLDINGGFNWYGPIIVTGQIKFTGGGALPKNVFGALIAGGSTAVDVVGGSANIVYCSTAINPTDKLPLTCLNWKEEM